MAKRDKTRDEHQLMRIELPKPVVSGNMRFGLPEFVQFLIDTQPAFTKTAHGLRAGVRIEAALAAAADCLVLQWRDLRPLQQAAQEPVGGYPLRGANGQEGVNRLCLAAVDALLEAEEVQEPADPGAGAED